MPIPKLPKVKVAPLSGVAAPDVMTRSQITDLANAIKNREGLYGVRRVERAADEIPNLESLYTQQALADAFSGDNARALMTMNPADFERYAAPIGDSFKLDIYQPEQGRRLQARGEGLLPPITGDEYIKHLAQIKQQGGFSDIPYLNVNKEEQGLPDYPFISGHEGRHRNRAMAALGEQAGLVQFLPRAELREPFPRRMSEQYIDAIRKEMGLSGNFVLPQKYHIPSEKSLNDVVVNRPAIELPDLYADGGMVDSVPEEAIKNTITDPQAFRMLDMDLANLALMSQQPQRMAGGGASRKIAKAILPKPEPLNAIQEMIAAANNTTRTAPETEAADLLGRVAASAGMKPPVTATKPLTDLQDFHTSLDDRINERVRDMQNLADSMTFRYQPKQFVHSQHTLDKEQAPHEILASLPFRRPVMREDKPYMSQKDEFGKTVYTPWEPGYRVRHTISPDEWHEYQLPESALIKPVDDYNKGGAVRKAEGGIVNDIYNNVIPAQVRTYAETMFGNRSPITENNFSSAELDMMRDAIAVSRQDRTATNNRLYQEQLAAAKNEKEKMNIARQGPSPKLDQTVGYQHYPNSGDQSTRDDNNIGYDSAVRNTLGRFAYEKDANGNLIATDTYKFRDDLPGQTRPSSDYAKMSTFEKIGTLLKDSSKEKAGLGTLLSRAGSAFIGADGRPVNVNLGKAKFAHGGAVHKADGGAIHMDHGDITPRAFSYSPTDRDEHNRKLGLPAEFYRAGQADPTMQSYGAGVSVPVGGARLTADAIAARNAQMRDTLAGIMLGAEFPVGEGTLRAETMRPTMQGASPTYGLRYNQRFANGGQVQRFDEGGEVNQAELDRMRFELSNSPVIERTPQSMPQKMIGTFGGYMDQAGKFISESLKPIAETHPIRTFLTDMLLADPLKSAGAALQDYTKTGREITEEQPYTRSPVTGSGQTLRLDPRVLDIAQFATPVVGAGLKAARAGAKAIAPFASKVDDMVRELSASGAMPQPGLSIKDVTPKVLAPANVQGFYSPTEAAALNLQRQSGNGQAFLNDLMKGENVSSEEISGMGLDTFLKGRTSVTAAEVQGFIAQNKLGLGEARYGVVKEDPVGMAKRKEIFDSYQPEIDRLHKEYNVYYEAGDNASRRKVGDQIINVQLKRNSEANSAYEIPNSKPTNFQGHSLPSGENYREVVITLPSNRPSLKNMSRSEYNAAVDAADKAGVKDYQSSHWDELNPLAHLRMSDRVTDGKKTLLVDEVQSDWHQAGRDARTAEIKRLVDEGMPKEEAQKSVSKNFGYRSESDSAQAAFRNYQTDVKTRFEDALRKEYSEVTSDPEMIDRLVQREVNDKSIKQMSDYFGEGEKWKSLYDNYNSEWGNNKRGVPNAPYKEDWYQLALRRAVKEAIDGGYDRVALPTGARVAERFSLTKYIESISHRNNPDGTYAIVAVDKKNNVALNDQSVSKEKLSEMVGKDIAQKIVNAEGQLFPKGSVAEGVMPGMKKLSGLDLRVGGEGMKKYYDEIYPSYLKKFGKKYGASTGMTSVLIEPPTDKIFTDLGKFHAYTGQGRETKEFNTYAEALEFLGMGKEPLHYMDITPAMRKEFSTGIHMAKGGKVSFADSLDAMRHELTQRQ